MVVSFFSFSSVGCLPPKCFQTETYPEKAQRGLVLGQGRGDLLKKLAILVTCLVVTIRDIGCGEHRYGGFDGHHDLSDLAPWAT